MPLRLPDEDAIDVGYVTNLYELLRAIDEVLPKDATLYIEGTSIVPTVTEFLREREAVQATGIKPNTRWPKPRVFHLPLTGTNLRELRALASKHAEPEVADQSSYRARSHPSSPSSSEQRSVPRYASVARRRSPGAYTKDGFTALHLAAFFGQPGAARVLLEAGADAGAVSKNSMRVQPLHSAAAARNLEAARLLLEAGADPNAVQQDEFRPLDAAIQNEDEPLRELLLEHGADPNLVKTP